MKVKGFKDITGQEFLADVVKTDNVKGVKVWTLKNATCFMPTENGIVPMPYAFLGLKKDPKIEISDDKLLISSFDVEERLANQYKQLYGGIVESESKLILPNS